MIDILNWSLEHPLATFLWFLMATSVLNTVAKVVLALSGRRVDEDGEDGKDDEN